jgi:hypothetical protein
MGGHLKRLAALLLFLCAAVASAQNYILTQTLGTPRSDFTGYVGFYFDTAGNTPTVTQLCRWKIAGNSQTHALYLFKYVDGGAGDVQFGRGLRLRDHWRSGNSPIEHDLLRHRPRDERRR